MDIEGIGKKLGALLGLVAALLAFFGAKDGGLLRIIRNYPEAALFFLITTIGGILALLLASQVKDSEPDGSPHEARLFWIFLIVLTLAWANFGILYAIGQPRRVAFWAAVGISLLFVVLLVTPLILRLPWLVFREMVPDAADDASSAQKERPRPRLVPLLTKWDWPTRIVMLMLGGIVAALGIFGAVRLAALSQSSKDRPSVTAKVVEAEDGQLSIEGHVKASGLRVSEHVLLRVEGVELDGQPGVAREAVGQVATDGAPATGAPPLVLPRGRQGWTSDGQGETDGATCQRCQLLYGERIGASLTGDVDFDFTIPLTTALYDRLDVVALLQQRGSDRPGVDGQHVSEGWWDGPLSFLRKLDDLVTEDPPEQSAGSGRCDGTTDTMGCLSLYLPAASSHPSLSATWGGTADAPTVNVDLKMSRLYVEDEISLRVLSGTSEPYLDASVFPDENGAVARTFVVPVDKHETICVVANLTHLGGFSPMEHTQTCSDPGDNGSTVVLSALPDNGS